MKSPAITQATETITEEITTLLNRLQTLIEVSAGKITKAEIRSVPSIRMPTTMVIAVSTETVIL